MTQFLDNTEAQVRERGAEFFMSFVPETHKHSGRSQLAEQRHFMTFRLNSRVDADWGV